jgi:hypothetical protein
MICRQCARVASRTTAVNGTGQDGMGLDGLGDGDGANCLDLPDVVAQLAVNVESGLLVAEDEVGEPGGVAG